MPKYITLEEFLALPTTTKFDPASHNRDIPQTEGNKKAVEIHNHFQNWKATQSDWKTNYQDWFVYLEAHRKEKSSQNDTEPIVIE